MQLGGNINTLMQRVMAMKSPELIEVLPSVEAMPFDERVMIVRRSKENLDSLIKHWDKFADVLSARGLSKSEVKRKAKDLKNVRSKLDMALRLADPKVIPGPLRSQAESAFNVVAAWFELNKDYMESVYAAPKLSRQDIGKLELPSVGESDQADLVDREALVDGPSNARTISEDDIVDIMDASGKSTVH